MKIRHFISLAALSLAWAHGADPSHSTKVFKVCTVDWPPFVEVDSKTKDVTGTHTDVVRKLFKDIGVQAQIDSVPWKRCLEQAKLGKYDMVYSASKKPDREEYLAYPTKPIAMVEYVVVTTDAPESVKWTDKRDATTLPQPIGSPLGYSVTIELQKNKGIKVDDSAKDDRENFKKLAAGRVKTIVILRQAFDEIVKDDQGKGKYHVLPVSFEEGKPYFLTVRKDYDDGEIKATHLLKAIDAVMK